MSRIYIAASVLFIALLAVNCEEEEEFVSIRFKDCSRPHSYDQQKDVYRV